MGDYRELIDLDQEQAKEILRSADQFVETVVKYLANKLIFTHPTDVQVYAKRFSLHLIFALLAPPWVLRAVVGGFVGLPGDAAVVLADWKGFGELSLPQWGAVRKSFA